MTAAPIFTLNRYTGAPLRASRRKPARRKSALPLRLETFRLLDASLEWLNCWTRSSFQFFQRVISRPKELDIAVPEFFLLRGCYETILPPTASVSEKSDISCSGTFVQTTTAQATPEPMPALPMERREIPGVNIRSTDSISMPAERMQWSIPSRHCDARRSRKAPWADCSRA